MYLSYRFLRQKIQKNKNSNGKKLFLLIPVFNEQTVIEDSVKHFSQFASNYIKIVYITTSREKSIHNFPTTKELLEKMSKLYCFELINCPITKNAVMAHQLNYALVQLQKQYGDDFILGIYANDRNIDLPDGEKLKENLERHFLTVLDVDKKTNNSVSIYLNGEKLSVSEHIDASSTETLKAPYDDVNVKTIIWKQNSADNNKFRSKWAKSLRYVGTP